MFPDLTKYEAFVPEQAPTVLDDLDSRLKIYTDGKIDVWYAPLGIPVQNPDLWILGITPGWNQMRIAYESAADALQTGHSRRESIDAKKPTLAFAGSMRKNLVAMLDEIGLNRLFGLHSTFELFGSKRLRTGSVLRYPVFNRQKNYTGSSPSPLNHAFLKSMLDEVFAEELIKVGHCPIIPLGKTVEQVLAYSVEQGRLDPGRILKGFPHPSGANGHRISQFKHNRQYFERTVNNWFGSNR